MPPDDESTLAFTRLTPDDIMDAIDATGFVLSGRFLALNSYENRVYKLGLEEGGDIVAKFYRPQRWSDEQILEEHRFTEDIADEEIPVIAPIDIDGQTLFEHGPFRFAMYPCHGGRSPELDDEDQLRQLGRFVARIHLIGELSEFAHRPGIDIDSYAIDSMHYLLDEGFIPDDMADVYAGVADQVIEGVRACEARAGNVRRLRLHGDFHPGNVLVADERFHIVDLDDCRTGPAVQDLWMFLSGDREEQMPQLGALLDGYEDFRRFDARELNLVESLRSLRIMHYAAWLARRWDDPAFHHSFPWFDTRRYWEDHVLALREQVALMQEPPIEWHGF